MWRPARLRITRPTASSTLDGIASLVDKSLLLWRNATASGRLGMLETIREFALEQLAAAGEEDRARAAHAAYFATLDAWLEPNHVAPGERVDDRLWAIEAELANLRAALSFPDNAGDAEGVLQLAGSLAIFWHHRGNLAEGRQWLEWALEHTPGDRNGLPRPGPGRVQLDPRVARAPYARPALQRPRLVASPKPSTTPSSPPCPSICWAWLRSASGQWAQATSHMTEALALWRCTRVAF